MGELGRDGGNTQGEEKGAAGAMVGGWRDARLLHLNDCLELVGREQTEGPHHLSR